ncbi:hypothetical protein C5167_038473 [Papaver somniferum]|uniref:Uncharacterized protein n=1 Tax=Papaver somniferum TaxID=3469 RepID=A0A4Y7I998_PAPSO|nr:hypothetical protein C5167_038473 [Papaver somniferum]
MPQQPFNFSICNQPDSITCNCTSLPAAPLQPTLQSHQLLNSLAATAPTAIQFSYLILILKLQPRQQQHHQFHCSSLQFHEQQQHHFLQLKTKSSSNPFIPASISCNSDLITHLELNKTITSAQLPT